MAKSLKKYLKGCPLTNEFALAKFALETCVPVIGSSLLIGSSHHAYSHEKCLYRAYLNWCNKSDYFPVPLATFELDIVIVIANYLKWDVYRECVIERCYREYKIFGISYRESGAANHG